MQKKFTFIYLALALIVYSSSFFPEAVETLYSQGVYPITSAIQRIISSFLPFALGDFLYAILIIYVFRKVTNFISRQNKTKKDYLSFGLKCVNFILLIYISFKLLWGLNYSRPSINQQLQINIKPYKKEQLLKLNTFFLQKLDSLDKDADTTAVNYNLQELEDIAATSYNQLAQKQPFFKYKYMAVKPVTSSWLTSKMGIEGYYNPLSGEANVNQRLPNFVLPFVTCHEIAHQLGVAKEDEANLIGYLTAVHSSNSQFQYSAYYSMFRYVLFEIRMKYPEDYNVIITKIPASVMEKFNIEKEFWAQYNGAMSVYLGKTFDKILKLNNQSKGIKSYQDIVLWLVNYHQKEL